MSQLTETVDFAIVEVDHAPQVSIKVSDKNLNLAQKQVMIFGHPNGDFLHWSNFCQIQTVGEFNFTHNCDTQHGVSVASNFS